MLSDKLIYNTIIIVVFLLFIFTLFCYFKFYIKVGRRGWESFIPFYNTYIEIVKIAGLGWWYFLIYIIFFILSMSQIGNSYVLLIISRIFILFLNFLFFYNVMIKMNRKSLVYPVLGSIFPHVIIAIIALSDKFVYDNLVLVSRNGFIKKG